MNFKWVVLLGKESTLWGGNWFGLRVNRGFHSDSLLPYAHIHTRACVHAFSLENQRQEKPEDGIWGCGGTPYLEETPSLLQKVAPKLLRGTRGCLEEHMLPSERGIFLQVGSHQELLGRTRKGQDSYSGWVCVQGGLTCSVSMGGGGSPLATTLPIHTCPTSLRSHPRFPPPAGGLCRSLGLASQPSCARMIHADALAWKESSQALPRRSALMAV